MKKVYLFTIFLSLSSPFLLAQDGSLDASFGTSGKAITPIGSADDGGRSVAIQADGKIVVGGYTDAGAATNWDFAIVRYKTDGVLDGSFGANGKVVTSMGKGDDAISAVLI